MKLFSITNGCLILGAVLSLGAVACDKAVDDEKKASVAQTEADQKVADAHASFMKLREDYRHATTVNLVDLDRDVDSLAAKAKQSSGKTRADLDARLLEIQASRSAFMKDYASLDSVAGASWDDTKVRLDKEWTDLKALVDKS
jgi:hypothetical protein